jgi:hypothetical protein
VNLPQRDGDVKPQPDPWPWISQQIKIDMAIEI